MRDYSTVKSTFWTGATGRALRKLAEENRHLCQSMALYLITSPHANMIGLYYLPITLLCHEVGCSFEGALEALRSLKQVDFCDYDPESEMVWVYEMARFQVGGSLKANDKRTLGIAKEYDLLPKNIFLGPFFDRYEADFHIKKRRTFEGASEPHRSQEQEQEQEQEQTPSSEGVAAASATALPPPEKPAEKKSRKTATAIPDEFDLTPEMIEWAKSVGANGNIHLVTDSFLDHHRAKGSKFIDWIAAWRTWVRNEVKFSGKGHFSQQGKIVPLDWKTQHNLAVGAAFISKGDGEL